MFNWIIGKWLGQDTDTEWWKEYEYKQRQPNPDWRDEESERQARWRADVKNRFSKIWKTEKSS